MSNPFFYKNSFCPEKVVESLLRHGDFIYDPESDLMYAFNGRYYVILNETIVIKRISFMIGERHALTDIKKVLEQFKWRTAGSSIKDATPPKGLVNLENCVLDVRTRAEYFHSSQCYFFSSVPVVYDPKATCEKWIAFINQIYLGRECLVRIVQEIFGYCLIFGNWLQKAFIFYGEGANGKSTLLEVLRALLGKENTSSLSMKDLGSTFRSIELMNKLASMSDESPTSNTIESEAFKSLVGGGTIIAEKKFKNPVYFKNGAKLIFATNKCPQFKDHSYGFYRRIVIIPHDLTLRQDERNPNLENELIEELPGILNWALEGLDRLLEQGQLTHSEFVEKKMHDLKVETDSVASFVEDKCLIDSTSETLVDNLYSSYQKYCQDDGLKAVAKNNFGQRLKTHYGIEKLRPRVGGDRKYAYSGICLNKPKNNSEMIQRMRKHFGARPSGPGKEDNNLQ